LGDVRKKHGSIFIKTEKEKCAAERSDYPIPVWPSALESPGGEAYRGKWTYGPCQKISLRAIKAQFHCQTKKIGSVKDEFSRRKCYIGDVASDQNNCDQKLLRINATRQIGSGCKPKVPGPVTKQDRYGLTPVNNLR